MAVATGKFKSSSNEEIVFVRIASTPHVDWQLANSRETQVILESRKRFRAPDTLDARRPGTKWAAVDLRALAPQDSYLVQSEYAALGDPENEARHPFGTTPFHICMLLRPCPGCCGLLSLAPFCEQHDMLGHAAMVWVLGSPTSGITPMSRLSLEGATDRVCSFSYLQRHLKARCATAVVGTHVVAAEGCVWDASPFLRGCAPVHAKLIAHGLCDWRPDGWCHGYKLTGGDYRLFSVTVGGVAFARIDDRTVRSNVQVGDSLYALLVADVYDPQHEPVASSAALAAWLEREAADLTYTLEEREAYTAERDALLALPMGAEAAPVKLAQGTPLKLSNFRLRLATSSMLWNGDGAARTRLGLRASSAGGMAECVVGAYRLARVLETQATPDGLWKVLVAIQFLESSGVFY